MGNLGSIVNMFKKIGAKAKVSSDLEEINNAPKLLLPGVGAFDNAMQKMNDAGMISILNNKALKEKVPILGICLGMQLLTHRSDEGKLAGLGWIEGQTLAFRSIVSEKTRIPHMGWNTVAKHTESPLSTELNKDAKFYFVHSYYVKCENEKNAILKTRYEIEFDSAIQKDNIFGAQFHPEKSHKYGMKLFENFNKL